MIRILDELFDPKVWDTVARHPLQSWEWGDARMKLGIEVLRIGEFANSKLKSVLLVMLHKVPYTNYCVGYCPRSGVPSNDMVMFLTEYARTHRIIHVQFEPDVREGNSGSFSHPYRPSLNPLFPRYTQVLDIQPSDDSLLKNMKPKTRYNIRLAQRKGVTVKEMTDDEGFEIFSSLYFRTTGRQKYYGHNEEYHRTVFNTLRGSIAHILIAYYANKPLAAYELFHFHKTLYYPYGGSSEENKEVMAANLLMWEAIRFGKKKGATSFDMWGSLAPDYAASDHWAGFTRFKEGYGTEYVKMAGSYDLVINPLLYKIFSTAYRIRNKII